MAREPIEMTEVDEGYATDGPNRNVIRQPIAAPAAAVFGCLADGPAWKEWLGIEVEWTSPEPHGVGATRTARTRGQVIDETFLAWEPGRRINFRFDRSTLPVSAFAEDYVVDPTGNTSSELIWSYAFEWRGPLASLSSRAFAAVFAANGRRAVKKLAALVEVDPGRFLAGQSGGERARSVSDR